MDCKITIVLDTRFEKKDSKYPVKLRVWDKLSRKAKQYSTGIDLTKKEYESVWKTKKPRKEYHQTRDDINSNLRNAETVAAELKLFSFRDFERKLFRKVGDEDNILASYQKIIDRLNRMQQYGTKTVYEGALKSIKDYLKHSTGKETIQRLSFFEITPEWLQDYETYMIKTLGKSPTTVSMRLRTLKTIFNTIIEDGDLPPDVYPFGKRKYQIPNHRNIKKALTIDDLRKLKVANPDSSEQQKARDYFLLSFACNGMNIKDIAMLKWENLEEDSSGKKIVYYREKIKTTTKKDQRPTIIYLTELAEQIITRVGSKDRSQDSFIFPILDKNIGEAANYMKVKNFTRFVNQHLKKLAKDIKITEDISTYYARHSFATIAIRSGASMEFVSEALSHRDMKTTQNYFAGFDDDAKREIMRKVTEL